MYEVNEHGMLKRSHRLVMMRLICVEVIIVFTVLTLVASLMLQRVSVSMPSEPRTWFAWSTISILISSGLYVLLAHTTLHRHLKAWLFAGLYFVALAFVVTQGLGFYELERFFSTAAVKGANLQLLYVVIALHGLHVLLGIILLTTLWHRLSKTEYSEEGFYGMKMSELYWHLLTVVWVVIYAIL